MTLMKAVLRQMLSQDDTRRSSGKYVSPPPEIDTTVLTKQISPKLKKRVYKYAGITARVDSSAPSLCGYGQHRKLEHWKHNYNKLHADNIHLLTLIRKTHFLEGKVECHWKWPPFCSRQYHNNRVNFLKRVQRDNLSLYKRITSAHCRVPSTVSLNQEWLRNREKIIRRAENTFVLFPPVPCEVIEDRAFAPPAGVKRPRVYMTIGVQDCAILGALCIELFTDVCPLTCQLFTELLDGDTLGHGYVGTCFFRRIPCLYWSGGDVIYNNGFGCYAQRGRVQPIGAENYHFSHSMPGLLSMRVTCDNEVCGIFNITFKALPQFDLRNIVFGRIIRPSQTYGRARELGKAFSTYPIASVMSTRRQIDGHWVKGKSNTRLVQQIHARKAFTRQR